MNYRLSLMKTVCITALVMLFVSGTAFGQPSTSITNTGFNASQTGGGSLKLGWTTGNLGNTWSEGEWVPYQVIIDNVQTDYPDMVGFPTIVMSYDFTGGGAARFVDLVRGWQVGTVQLADSQGWPRDDHSAYPMTTRDEVEAAQNDVGNTAPLENTWPGFLPIDMPDSQLNRYRVDDTTFSDGTPTDAEHVFYITRQDLIDAGLDTTTNTIILYYQLHESRTFVWLNSLQEQYDTPETDGWGGYLYNDLGAYAADSREGSGFVPGSSGHIEVEFASGAKTVPIPIPEQLPGNVTGLKWLDQNGNGIIDGGETLLSGWRVYVSGTLEGILFRDTVETDETGHYMFPNLTSATMWTVKEDAQRFDPSESGYLQTYPLVGTTIGDASQSNALGISVSPPPSGVADVGWLVELTRDYPDRDSVDFGNKLCELACTGLNDTTIQCDGDWSVAALGQPTIDYNCPPIDTNFSEQSSGRCPTTIHRVWIYTDAIDNADTCEQWITVVDTTDPSITAPPDVVFDCVMGDAGVPTDTSDNCGIDSVRYSDDTTNYRCPLEITRTWTVWDTCGNSDFDIQYITVQDTANPSITAPDDIVFDCVMGDPGDPPDTSDNCAIDSVRYSDDTTNYRCPLEITRTWTVWDTCGNSDFDIQYITVQDTADPWINAPADVVFDCVMGDPLTADDYGDNCAIDSVVYSDDTTSYRCPLIISRTWTVYDTCGNFASDVQSITVQDTADPTVDAPADIVFDCVMGDPGDASYDDNCAIDSTNYVDDTLSYRCPLIIDRTFRAWDTCGNFGSDVQRITVQDTANPTVDAPDDIVFDCVMGNPGDASYDDNCAVDSTKYVDDTVSYRCPLIIDRTFWAWDTCGNSASDVQRITVQDTANPTITAPDDIVFECVLGTVGEQGEPTYDDNCYVDSVVLTIDTTNLRCPFEITRKWTVWDSCGNSAVDSQMIIVQDTTDPVVVAPNDTTFECVMGDAGVPVDTSDDCYVDSVRFSDDTTNARCPLEITRTWYVWDSCGNMGSDQQLIVVQDTTPPTITCPVEVDTIPCGDTAVFTDPEVSDNCEVDTVMIVLDTSFDAGGGATVYRRCWAATDTCGNTSDTCCQDVVEVCGNEGCTPGFWKNSTAYWDNASDDYPQCIAAAISSLGAPYGGNGTTSALFRVTFGLTPAQMTAAGLATDLTLLEAINLGGGNCEKLARHGVAALINTCAVDYGMTPTQVLTAIHDAYVANTCEPLATDLAALNNRDCPIPSDNSDIFFTNEPEEEELPTEYGLDQNYPNPFNPVTEISFSLPTASHVTLEVYNVLGQRVVTLAAGYREAGRHTVTWDASHVSSGIYFYRLRAGEFQMTRKMILLK